MTRHISWNDEIAGWRAWLKAGAVSDETLKLRTYHLERFARDHAHREPFGLEPDDLAAWMARHEWSPATLHSYRSSLRSFYGWAHAAGHTDADPSRLLRKVKLLKGVARPAPEGVIDAALEDAAAREWLILMLGSRVGMRRGEISRVHSKDLLDDGGGDFSLLVHGKGNVERVVPLPSDVADAIRRPGSGWIFPNGLGSHVSPAHVGVLARRAMSRAGSTHQLRHRFGVVTYDATHDIRAVQELLGHASVATTEIYTRVRPDSLRRVMQTAA